MTKIAVRVHDDRQRFAEGGLAQHAAKVAGAGRNGDSVLVHLSPQEFESLRGKWGEPTKNPKTGLPEYFLSGLQKWFNENPWASVALPVATSALGAGNFIGSGLNSMLGTEWSGTTQNAIGNGLLGGGLGALTGGTSGALTGALIGGASPYVMNMLSDGSGSGSGILSNLFNGGNGSSPSNAGSPAGDGGGIAGGNVKPSAGTGITGSGLGGLGGAGKMLPLLMAAGALSSMTGKKQKAAPVATSDPNMTRPLSEVKFDRQQNAQAQAAPVDGNYGAGPQRKWFDYNQLPQMAEGGEFDGEGAPVSPVSPLAQMNSSGVRGPGSGRDDKIPALLSDGEFVMDAESVALLGDGSSEEGARRLEQMRENLRRHKGAALAQGKFSPPAKAPEQYLQGGAR